MIFKKLILLTIFFIIIEINCEDDKKLEFLDLKTKECKFTEPLYKFDFDFSQLRNDFGHRINLSDNDNGDHTLNFLEFNVCSVGWMKQCGNITTAGACLHNDDKGTVLGYEANLTLADGQIFFNYIGDECEKGENYKFTILLVCDYLAGPKDFKLMPSMTKCDYFVMWSTKYACSPYMNEIQLKNDCVITNEKSNHTFNLLPLSRYNHKVTTAKNSTYIINVCRPVLYGHNEMCPPNSSVCLINQTETDLLKKFKNFGTTSNKLILENGILQTEYLTTEKCTDTEFYRTNIQFHCNPDIEFGEPEYLDERNCKIQFKWETSYACDVRVPCLEIDPITGFKYDLSSLSKQSYNITHNNKSYTFGVCSTPINDECLENSGACQTDNGQSTSMGKINGFLMINESGGPYLVYNSGATCEKMGKQWKTIINFICSSPELQKNGPFIIEDTNCQLIIEFYTKLACQKEIDCSRAHNASDDNSEIDITSLIQSTDNYIARINETTIKEDPNIKYFINVCRPLVPKYGLNCQGSSACRTKINADNSPEEEQSLGYSDVSLTVVDTVHGSRAQLLYLRGGVCEKDHNNQLSTIIEFYCDEKAGKGTPILQEIIHDCHYRFDWPTSVICPKKNDITRLKEDSCTLYNNELKTTLDMTKQFTNHGQYELHINDFNFKFNICTADIVITSNVQRSQVKINVNSLDKTGCNGSPLYAEILFTCAEKELWINKLNWNCILELEKQSPDICPLLGIPMPGNTNGTTITIPTEKPADKPTDKPTDKPADKPTDKPADKPSDKPADTPPSNTEPDNNSDSSKPDVTKGGDEPISGGISALGTTLIIFSIMGILGSMFFVFKSPERRDRVVSFCQRRIVPVQYSRVRNNEEGASLLIAQPNNTLIDSDDELLI